MNKTQHPLIQNSQEYVFQKKYVSIHSEDRDILKYPISSSFEIELPDDYTNIQTVKIANYTFPSNFYVFSSLRYNTSIVFTITEPYDPSSSGSLLDLVVYNGLSELPCSHLIATINEGNYTPYQMAKELTNALNASVTEYLTTYITENEPSVLDDFLLYGYNQFIVVYNETTYRLWFGNKSSKFDLICDSDVFIEELYKKNTVCQNKYTNKEYINWGLPYYLGFEHCTYHSTEYKSSLDTNNNLNVSKLPRFTYGEVSEGDDGYWLLPSYNNVSVYAIESSGKINLHGETCFYMEIAGLNCIDGTDTYNISYFTSTTNQTNGTRDTAFCKIPIILASTPNREIIHSDINLPYKYYNPPLEKLRKLYIKIRNHNGLPVDFGNSNFTFTLEFGLLLPQTNRKYLTYVPQGVI